jgi:hypothetical protein
LDLAKRALLEGHWRRTSDVKGDKAVENMRLLVVLGEDPATETVSWLVTLMDGEDILLVMVISMMN